MYNTLINAEELAAEITKSDWVIFDCRFDLFDPDAGYRQHIVSRIPGARYAHLDWDLSGVKAKTSGRHPLPTPEQFTDWLGLNGVDRQKQVVVYDQCSGAIAARLWWMLQWMGHNAVAVLNGGWQRWTDRGLPVETKQRRREPTKFLGTPQSHLWLTTKEVRKKLERGEIVLWDARSPERFSGQIEPIDRIGGHVPGAENLPFSENMDGAEFQSPESLNRRYKTSLGDQSPGRVVHMCGSGVTACHNILAMETAGLPGSRLYAGSWSEWISDPDRPVIKL